MDVVIEIPAWSFRKVRLDPTGWRQQFWSVLPCPFNYGFVDDREARLPEGVRSEDGDPPDVIVIGPRQDAGTRLSVRPRLAVAFLDAGRRDDKLVARLDGRPLRLTDHLMLRLFFGTYVWLKRLREWMHSSPSSSIAVLGFYSLSDTPPLVGERS